MSFPTIVAKEMAKLCKLAGHPDRIRLISSLRLGPKDVSTLADTLDLTNSRVSQHLSLLKAHRYVEDSRDGRRQLYSLTHPGLAEWFLLGLDFIESQPERISAEEIKIAKRDWSPIVNSVEPN